MEFLDLLFHFLHLMVIVINLFFWIFKRTRKVHLIVFSLTSFSWLVLGMSYGWGYCFLTDWHWQIKRTLGEVNIPSWYITYWFNSIFDLGFNERVIDQFVLGAFVIIFVCSTVVHIIDIRHRKNYTWKKWLPPARV